MKVFTRAIQIAAQIVTLFLMSGSVSATTYNYMGAPFTIFSGG